MNNRSWHLTVQHLVRNVREGKIEGDAIDDMELALLNDADPEEEQRMIKLGDIELGSWQNAFSWLAKLARFRFVRFFGVSWGRCYFGLIRGSAAAPTEEIRKARVDELVEKQEREHGKV